MRARAHRKMIETILSENVYDHLALRLRSDHASISPLTLNRAWGLLHEPDQVSRLML
jgi:hypothetical protein